MPTRRDFLRLALTTPLLPACAPRSTLTLPAAPPPATPPPPPTPPSAPAPTDPLTATADGLVALLRARYGARASDAEWTQVRDAVRDQLRLAEQLRRRRLEESTEAAGHYYLAARMAVEGASV